MEALSGARVQIAQAACDVRHRPPRCTSLRLSSHGRRGGPMVRSGEPGAVTARGADSTARCALSGARSAGISGVVLTFTTLPTTRLAASYISAVSLAPWPVWYDEQIW